MPITMASGGWLATPTAMVWFLTALDGSRGKPFLSPRLTRAMVALPPSPIKPRPNGTHVGLGWDQVRLQSGGATYQKGGGLPGVHAIIKHTAGGLDWAFFANGGRGGDEEGGRGGAWASAVKAVEDELNSIESWPSTDLFRTPASGPES